MVALYDKLCHNRVRPERRLRKTVSRYRPESKTEVFQYWGLPSDALPKTLNNAPSGFTDEEAEKRLTETGPNSRDAKKRLTPFGMFLNQFKSPIVLILPGATIHSTFMRDWADVLIILTILRGSADLGSYHNAAGPLRQ